MEHIVEAAIVSWGCIGIMEHIMEATILVYWGYIGIMKIYWKLLSYIGVK